MKLNSSIVVLAGLMLVQSVEAVAADFQGKWRLVSEQRGVNHVKLVPMTCNIDTTKMLIEFKVGESESNKVLGYELKNATNPWHIALENGNQLVVQCESDSQLLMYSVESDELSLDELPTELREGWILRTFDRMDDPVSQKAVSAASTKDEVSILANANAIVERPPSPKPRPSNKSQVAEILNVSFPVKEKYLSLWTKTRPDAANELAMEFRIRKKILGLEQQLDSLELKRVLALDQQRMKEHLLAVEKTVRDLEDASAQQRETMRQFVGQELQLIRETCSDSAVLARANEFAEAVEPYVGETGDELKEFAMKTFERGVPILINYAGPEVIELDDSVGILNLELPLQYLRNAELPPGGCRVVAKLAVKKGEQSILLSHMTDYQPCVFQAGNLRAEFCALGEVPLTDESVLFVYVTSLNESERGEIVPFSNILTIPVAAASDEQPDVEKPVPLLENENT